MSAALDRKNCGAIQPHYFLVWPTLLELSSSFDKPVTKLLVNPLPFYIFDNLKQNYN